MNEIISFFTDTETPFLLLFVILFYFYIRETKAREERAQKQIDTQLEKLEQILNTIKEDQKNMLSIWKILIEKELERRYKNDHGTYEHKHGGYSTRSGSDSASNKNDNTRK